MFGTEFNGPIHRFGDMPPNPGHSPMPEADRNPVMHVELPILVGHVPMGTDAPESMDFQCRPGNNVYINLETDSREQTDRLFAALSAGGQVEMPLQDMFWGAYFASFADRFGVRWTLNCANAGVGAFGA